MVDIELKSYVQNFIRFYLSVDISSNSGVVNLPREPALDRCHPIVYPLLFSRVLSAKPNCPRNPNCW